MTEEAIYTLPPPDFRLTWRDGAYRVSRPRVGDAECFSAEQVRAAYAAGKAAAATPPNGWVLDPEPMLSECGIHTYCIDVDGHGAAIECHGETEALARARADAVLRAAVAAPAMSHDDRVLWGVVANAGRLSTKRQYRWSHVMDATGQGSTASMALCRRFNFDPDTLIGGSADGETE